MCVCLCVLWNGVSLVGEEEKREAVRSGTLGGEV
ncbi:hypothetical protein DFP93_103305 [Aneurinibacillus soli]|uniref:Uncharacterized protein n=1 Tax=Aneurinibacillus soli TaxID=1500254 RepID=A0A0U5B2M5_9BACL|nr:hypothetical protein DFP93_103305 [Aneurinibacillus soli]BAU28850.1 hypothetical protein CB4_03027 [Aneurinibacillus soli]